MKLKIHMIVILSQENLKAYKDLETTSSHVVETLNHCKKGHAAFANTHYHYYTNNDNINNLTNVSQLIT